MLLIFLEHKYLKVNGRGLAVDEWISEIGGGTNFKRKKFLKLMRQIRLGEVSTIVVAHKDRLVRFCSEFCDSPFCKPIDRDLNSAKNLENAPSKFF